MAGDAKPESKPDAAAPPLPPLAGKAKDLEALRNAVVDAANVSGALWFSYLFVLLYLVIAAGSVTHRNLLFESPVKLPFLNVDLPLLGFFTLGPAIFLVVHAYVLLHFAMLADKVGAFHAELLAQIVDDDIRTRLRRQLPSNIFVQFLAGPREVRTGLMGIMLRLIALISLVAGPIALLLLFQIQFLPYHHEAATWWQRVAVVADLALLWALWPSVARGETVAIGWRDFKRAGVIAAAAASLATTVFVLTIATFPGEWLDGKLASARFIPGADRYGKLRWIGPHEYLFGGDVDFIARKPTSLWSNRLVLPNLDQPAETFSLRGRRLEGAVLLDARLRKIDFTAAQLQGAVLDDADLREAGFLCADSRRRVGTDPIAKSGRLGFEVVCAQLTGASLNRAQLQGARLDMAQLREASLDSAQLQGASLNKAQLQGALLPRANLQGASLQETALHGASLEKAQLQGAFLLGTNFNGATLTGAKLQGAYMYGAQLLAASLEGAEMQGALLEHAILVGTILDGAQLQGVSFDRALLYGTSFNVLRFDDGATEGSRNVQLQGATFDRTELQGASLSSAFVWRADARNVAGSGAIVRGPISTATHAELGCASRTCDWSIDSFKALRRLIEEQVPEGERRTDALKRIASLDPGVTGDDQADMAKAWIDLEQSSPPADVHQKDLAEIWAVLACEPSDAPYVIRALLPSISLRLDSKNRASIAAALLDEKKCRAARASSEDDRRKLRELRGPVTPPASGAAKQ